MSKILWFIPSPRRFRLFWSWVNRVDFVDKLIVKNHVHHDAIKIGMDYFKEHKEYTHLLLSSDDVLGTPEDVKMLIRDERRQGFPVVTGWNNTAHVEDHSNITVKRVSVVDENLNKIADKFRPSKVYPYLPIVDVVAGKYGYPFIKAWYAGFPLALIQRKTLMKIPFRPFMLQKDRFCTTPRTMARGRGKGYDLQFSIDCRKNKIPVMVDTRIFLLHFGKTKEFLRIGKDRSIVTLIKAESGKSIVLKRGPRVRVGRSNRTRVRVWKDRIAKNRSKKGKPWYYGLPYRWWYGMNEKQFLKALPSHLDIEREPKWFTD